MFARFVGATNLNSAAEKSGFGYVVDLSHRYTDDKGADWKHPSGAGQSGMPKLSDEAADFFEKKKCTVELFPTPEAIQRWNQAEGPAICLF